MRGSAVTNTKERGGIRTGDVGGRPKQAIRLTRPSREFFVTSLAALALGMAEPTWAAQPWGASGQSDVAQLQQCTDAAHIPGGGYCIDVYFACMQEAYGRDVTFPIPRETGFHNKMCSLFHKSPDEMIAN
ncbi:hypothetical protein BGLA2_420105 [Burkholderia gladioli]|nr:hypothetical protein BGLA2_420105 [Burkholderia gladioli]